MTYLIQYAMSFLGVPYKWAGSNPISGLDCSGLLQCILQSVGMDPPGDQTAQGLFNHFEVSSTWNSYTPGALAFFGESVTKITHVAFLIDQYRMIEAGGGGHLTLTKEDAALQNAFVRIRLIKSRKDLVAVIKPRYATIGMI